MFLASGGLLPARLLRVQGVAGLAWACSWQREVKAGLTAKRGVDGPAVLSTHGVLMTTVRSNHSCGPHSAVGETKSQNT